MITERDLDKIARANEAIYREVEYSTYYTKCGARSVFVLNMFVSCTAAEDGMFALTLVKDCRARHVGDVFAVDTPRPSTQ